MEARISIARPRRYLWLLAMTLAGIVAAAQPPSRQWLPGDSHIHLHWSPGYDRKTRPPTPVLGGDARYAIPLNARMAEKFRLAWMVTTDHGGPNHAKPPGENPWTDLWFYSNPIFVNVR